jgi:hypothetical protein
MSFNFFGFGRKRTRKTRKSSRKTAKPDKSLVKLCKKYGVKVTKKSGSKRVYKKTSVLKKQCAKKIRGIIKRKYKFGARRSGFGARGGRRAAPRRAAPRRVTSSMMVTGVSKPLTRRARLMAHLRRNRGRYAGATAATAAAAAGYALTRPRSELAMKQFARKHGMMDAASLPGGKAEADVYRQAAMAKPRSNLIARTFVDNMRRKQGLHSEDVGNYTKTAGFLFGKRRRGRRGVRRYRFGNGGNPPLSGSMGYEFCSGGGGVLGVNSTGLFPSPCMSATMPMMGAGPAAAFGKRRRRRM